MKRPISRRELAVRRVLKLAKHAVNDSDNAWADRYVKDVSYLLREVAILNRTRTAWRSMAERLHKEQKQ